MQIIQLNRNYFKTSEWSGGLTTELYIYPENSSYKNLDFSFRLSTATVDIDESTFSSIPNTVRKLMVVDGEIELIHEHHHRTVLKEFDVDQFNGSWNTKSVGRCVDFNLMMLGDTKGKLCGVSLVKKQYHPIRLNENSNHAFIYAYKGCIALTIENNSYYLEEMEALLITNPSASIIEIEGILDSKIVIVEIS